MPISKPLILLIDAYDSFSNNIVSLIETTLNASVRTVKIDNPDLASDAALHEELRHYAAVLCGPGPGHPENEQDVGIIRRIWRLCDEEILPVFGICLGFQSLCMEFGGTVKRLKGPQHGIIRKITHIGEDGKDGQDTIFDGVGGIHATLYQSLCGDIGQHSVLENKWQKTKWNATTQCPDLVPLAWVEWDGCEDNDSGVMDHRVLVGVQHKTKPFWALQYHPESVCTTDGSRRVIKNWFKKAQEWNRISRPKPVSFHGAIQGQHAVRGSLLGHYERLSSLPDPSTHSEENCKKIKILDADLENIYQSRTVKLPGYMSVADIVESVQNSRRDQIVLESSNANEISDGSADVRGKFSIIGLDVNECLRFEYRVGYDFIKAICPDENGEAEHSIFLQPFGGVWPFVAQFLEKRHIAGGNKDSPFWGGFMGYTTYEMGLEGIDVKSEAAKRGSHQRPDLCFAWVTRSLVVDHGKGLIYLQELTKMGSEDIVSAWMDNAALKLDAPSIPKPFYLAIMNSDESRPISSSSSYSQPRASVSTDSFACPSSPASMSSMESLDLSHPRGAYNASATSVKTPQDEEYESKVRRCQGHIRSGDSYELCLTDQTTVQKRRVDSQPNQSSLQNLEEINHHDRQALSSDHSDAWRLYRTLRTRQPAPFASFLRLGTATLISSSPERFLTWSATGHCELRPMKGTVRKSPAVSTLSQATALLDVPKEKAENLMIVDLVRHDLHGVCGAGNVAVPRLMVVEEYKSVFQMISVVQGKIPEAIGKEGSGRYTGIDVLAASLPPGSMTGAPKKRSCEILQEIEGKERSLYSGVVGYMDVGGRGDWSVTIRSMFRWDDEDIVTPDGERVETWHIGAGGAVTALSTAAGEREEMQTKLNGTLAVFK